MLLGFNLLLWSTHVTEEDFPILEKIKATGYDGVELPIFEGEPEQYRAVGQALKDNGLRATAVCIMPNADADCTSSDPAKRQAGLDHIKWAIDCMQAAGGETLCGPFHQPLGIFTGEPPTDEERQNVAETHKQAAAYAAQAGVTLAVEPLNRFECYVYNTVADAVDLVKQVDAPNYGILYDTFHANIEEKDPVGVIAPNVASIAHVHFSENDRGTPGKGHVPWAATMKALKSSGYDGWCTIEAFGRALPDLAAATMVWRDLSASPEEVYQFGHDFLRDQWAKA
ncbi:sugar phosphate isomerase/epimerase family protein [Bauldia sp.]|uniref:sugar phosphate isomerase/epimerase family protein n=1 Tax=Bauldia sp. TaxID=2575872 RepID=UPI003BA8FA5E